VFYVELTFPLGIKERSQRGKYGVVKRQPEEGLGYEKAISSSGLETLYVETTNKFSTRRKSQEWKLSHITLDGPADANFCHFESKEGFLAPANSFLRKVI
jgi:hypothetical protein